MLAEFGSVKSSLSQLRSDLKAADLGGMLSFAKGLRKFLRQQITLEQAEEDIKKALGNREERFLDLVRAQVYRRPGSPYLKLLKLAGCEFSDLHTSVRRHGLESTLMDLAREGVYLTSDEFRGKKEVTRGGQVFRVCPEDFERENLSSGIVTQSSGTKHRPLRSLKPLDWHAAGTSALAVYFAAHNLFSYAHAVYDAILPGSSINTLLHYAQLGIRTERWFARKIPANSRMEAWYFYLSTYLVVWTANCFGPGFPKPEFIDIRGIHRIVDWIAEKKRAGKNCCINTPASNAVRIAQLAWKMGVSLEGARFRVHGEPITDAKREAIERAGASIVCRYNGGMSLGGGYGCGNPLYTDEVHASEHTLAIIPNPKPFIAGGSRINPLLFTTLYPVSPRLFLNVENGDYATFTKRECGCALEKVGLKLHLHHIRSYEKFTSEGMNYFYGDLFEFFEKLLPAEFGGGPGDYQLVEEEDERGQTRLSLLVHPQVGELEEQRALARLRAALAEDSRGNRFMTQLWQDAGTFRVVRKPPHASPRGKILPLHMKQ